MTNEQFQGLMSAMEEASKKQSRAADKQIEAADRQIEAGRRKNPGSLNETKRDK
jgi:hypothetical protein